jgi:hypothetical protein
LAYEYVKSYYGVNPEPGMRVTMKPARHKSTCNSGLAKYPDGVPEGVNADRNCDCGKQGVIVRKRSYDNYVHVKFDGSKFDVPCHPMDLQYPQ